MKQGLSLRTAQHLTLTPQLQQSIRLLQLSTLELSQEISQQLQSNPFLEVEGDAEDEVSLQLQQDGSTVVQDLDRDVGDGDSGGFDDAEPIVATDWAQLSEAPAYEPASEWDGMESGATAPETLDMPSGADQPFEVQGPSGASALPSDDQDDWTATRPSRITLQDHLREQAYGLDATPLVQLALLFLIDSLDDHGFLAEPLDLLADELAKWVAQQGLPNETGQTTSPDWLLVLEEALEQLQQMDPCGVGASDLQECLRLQLLSKLSEIEHLAPDLQSRAAKTVGVALQVIKQPLEWVAKRDYRQLSKSLHQPEPLVRAACDVIKTLEPRPARPFADTRAVEMIPDVVVRRKGRELEVHLNQHIIPQLRVNSAYTQLVSVDKQEKQDKGDKSEKAQGQPPLQQALQDARWFVKSVAQRFDTILLVSRCIVQRQHAFFDKGPLALKPMVLREIADELGLHESTISRVTTAKYMATPVGTFELKYFFSSGLSTGGGLETSSTAVRQLIKNWVDNENPAKPLSDQKLAELLSDQGIECARRTVAKYREALKIAPTSLRRTH